jgi:PKD repeat protein
LSSLLLYSCSKNCLEQATNSTPHAKFSITVSDTNNIFENQAIIFKNESIGFTRCKWEFGNKVQSQAINPTHDYPLHGYYTVILTIWDESGQTSSATRDIPILCNFSPGNNTH